MGPSDQDAVAAIFATKRQPLWPWLAVVLATASVATGVFFWGPSFRDPPLVNVHVANQVRDALPLIEARVPQERGGWIAATLVDLLGERVPRAVRNGLQQAGDAPPGFHDAPWLNMLSRTAVRRMLTAVCPRANAILLETQREARHGAGQRVFERCELEQARLISAAEAAEGGPIEVLLAHAIHAHLAAHHVLTDLDTQALRLLARSSTEGYHASPPPLRAPATTTATPPMDDGAGDPSSNGLAEPTRRRPRGIFPTSDELEPDMDPTVASE